MKTQKGTTRRVFIFKHVVIKIAIFDWNKIFKSWKCCFLREIYFIKKYKGKYFFEKAKEQREYKKNLNEKRYEWGLEVIPIKRCENPYSSPWYYLLIGVLANLNERRFYKRTKNPFVMVTYFSFLGLVNIQKKGRKIEFWDDGDVFRFLCKNSVNRSQPHSDGHALAEIENFVIDDDDHLKLVDYGNRQVCPFLELNGKNLYDNFKLPE